MRVFLFLGLLNLELLLFHLFRLALLLLIFLFLFLLGLLLGDLGLLVPLLTKVALFEGDQSILSVLDLEGNVEGFILRVLWLGNKVSDMLVEAIYGGFVLNQNLYCLFASEFDCFTGWHFSTSLVNELALLLGVQL